MQQLFPVHPIHKSTETSVFSGMYCCPPKVDGSRIFPVLETAGEGLCLIGALQLIEDAWRQQACNVKHKPEIDVRFVASVPTALRAVAVDRRPCAICRRPPALLMITVINVNRYLPDPEVDETALSAHARANSVSFRAADWP